MTDGPPASGIGSRGLAERAALTVLVIVVGSLALALHRRGHSWGDDFALYLDQARSLWRGDAHAVIEVNRFNVLNAATPTFSPFGYPWGWPILLSPFVAVVGLDLDRLAVIEVVLLCLTVVALHRLVRRRAGASVALLVAAVVGLSPSILAHTDRLLTEIPHLLAVVVTLLWLDRITRPTERSAAWSTASTRDLVVLGVLAAVAFNIRREGLVLVVAIAAAQLVGRSPWRRAVVPHITFAGAVIAFQILLPTALLARYPGDGFSNASTMLDEWLPRSIALHLSFGEDGSTAARWFLVVALVGGLGRLVRHARTDVALVVVPVLTLALYARFPFGHDPRYYIQVLPFALYAAAQLPSTVAEMFRSPTTAASSPTPASHGPSWPGWRAAGWVTVVGLGALALVQVWHLPAEVKAARDFDAAGSVQFGPADPTVQAVLDAVDANTPPDAIIAFMRARTMSLYADRRSVQSSDLGVVLRRADYFAMLRGSDVSQPLVSEADAASLGLVPVWEDAQWVLWRIDRRPIP